MCVEDNVEEHCLDLPSQNWMISCKEFTSQHPPPAFWIEHSICLRPCSSQAALSQRVNMVMLSPTNSALCGTSLPADFVLELPQGLAETFSELQ